MVNAYPNKSRAGLRVDQGSNAIGTHSTIMGPKILDAVPLGGDLLRSVYNVVPQACVSLVARVVEGAMVWGVAKNGVLRSLDRTTDVRPTSPSREDRAALRLLTVPSDPLAPSGSRIDADVSLFPLARGAIRLRGGRIGGIYIITPLNTDASVGVEGRVGLLPAIVADASVKEK